MLMLTENAAKAVNNFIVSANKPIAGLRIKVEGGGCSGLKYAMRLEEQAADEDEVVEFGAVKVLIDSASAPMLIGVTVDYVESMEGSGFKFENPNATGGCGCGKSFSC
jgi:iron-sulfur cluster assembly protein